MIFILPIAICSVLRAKIGRRNKVTSSKAHLSFAKRQEMQYHHYSITQNVVFVQLCCAIFYILGMVSITTTVSRIAINIFIYILIFIFVDYTRLALLMSCTFGNSDHPYFIKGLLCFEIFCISGITRF